MANNQIYIISEHEEVRKSIRRYIKHMTNCDTAGNNNKKQDKDTSIDFGSVLKKLQSIDSHTLIIIDDFYSDRDSNFGGVALLKRIKIFNPSYVNNEDNNQYHFPILFLCADEVWRIEIASLRAGVKTIFSEEASFWNHLNVLKGVAFLKIPFSISMFKEIINLLLNCRFQTDRSKTQVLSALLGYEEHSKHH